MKESFGRKFFGLRIIRNSDVAFGKLVARECYNLTHELVRDKLYAAFTDTREVSATRTAWLELDRAVREFADKY